MTVGSSGQSARDGLGHSRDTAAAQRPHPDNKAKSRSQLVSAPVSRYRISNPPDSPQTHTADAEGRCGRELVHVGAWTREKSEHLTTGDRHDRMRFSTLTPEDVTRP